MQGDPRLSHTEPQLPDDGRDFVTGNLVRSNDDLQVGNALGDVATRFKMKFSPHCIYEFHLGIIGFRTPPWFPDTTSRVIRYSADCLEDPVA